MVSEGVLFGQPLGCCCCCCARLRPLELTLEPLKMEDWVPPPEYVASVTSMLADACSGETVAQMRAYETMTASLSLPPFVLTLAYVVAADALPRGEGVDTAVRARMRQVGAGALKTALTQSAKLLDEATLEFIKGYLPLMLGDRSPALRRMGAHIISALARHQGLDHWGQLVPMLSSALGNVESLPGALLCLSQLCEDVAAEFVDAVEDSTLAGLFPQLIALMAHGDIDIRKLATDCMRELQVVQSSAFLSVRQQYLSVRTRALLCISSRACACLRGTLYHDITVLPLHRCAWRR